MAKIFSILTLLIAAGAAYLGLESQKLVQNLQDTGKRTYEQLNATKAELTTTKAKLKESEEKLAATIKTLEETNSKLATSVEAEKKARTDLETALAAQKTAEGALASMTKTIEGALPPGVKLDDIGKLATAITDMTNKVKELETTVTTLTNDKANLTAKVEAAEGDKKRLEEDATKQKTVIDKYRGGIMQKSTKGRVLAVNAGWGFCVISIGDKQGAAANKVLIVARGGQAIGKVKITNVESTQSIADILPGSFAKGAYVQPGDEVIYTGDDKANVEENASGAASSTNPPLPH